jgi:ribonuclease J
VLRLFALGGLGEIGMNCLALEEDDRVLLVDCGVTFDARGLGVELAHPDFEALEQWRDKIVGVFVTHGHEDHIGAIPYLLRRHDVPVWGPPYALGLVRERLDEHEVLEHARLFEAHPGERVSCGPFTVEPIRVTHSIADATALAIGTSAGTVIHTGDFKIDPAPSDGERFDEERLAALGDAGVALLLSDSTNVDSEGPTGSEKGVGEALGDIVTGAKGAVFVALFASNVHRQRAERRRRAARHRRRREGRGVRLALRVERAPAAPARRDRARVEPARRPLRAQHPDPLARRDGHGLPRVAVGSHLAARSRPRAPA